MSYHLPGWDNVNTLSLLSYLNDISAYDSKAPAKSISAVLNKGIKLFSTFKFDVAPYIENSYTTVTEVGHTALATIRFQMLIVKLFLCRPWAST